MMRPPFSIGPIPRAWNDFWHQACDVRVCALIRICTGLLLFLNYAGAYPSVEMWWSEDGFMPLALSRRMLDPDVWSVFHWLPSTTQVLWTCYFAALVQSAMLTVGLFSRFNAASMWFWMVSFQHRNPLIGDGEDTLFRLISFLLIFMPAADLWSLDSKLFPRKSEAPRHGWALRMLQVVMFLVLWAAGLEKLAGGTWWSGAAMYYVMHLDDFYGHFPVPQLIVDQVWLARLLTWISLWIELLGPVLLWFKETRRWALISIIGLHLGIEYMMNVYLFEWVMITGWLSFMDWDDDIAWLKTQWGRVASLGRGSRQAAASGTT